RRSSSGEQGSSEQASRGQDFAHRVYSLRHLSSGVRRCERQSRLRSAQTLALGKFPAACPGFSRSANYFLKCLLWPSKKRQRSLFTGAAFRKPAQSVSPRILTGNTENRRSIENVLSHCTRKALTWAAPSY